MGNLPDGVRPRSPVWRHTHTHTQSEEALFKTTAAQVNTSTLPVSSGGRVSEVKGSSESVTLSRSS